MDIHTHIHTQAHYKTTMPQGSDKQHTFNNHRLRGWKTDECCWDHSQRKCIGQDNSVENGNRLFFFHAWSLRPLSVSLSRPLSPFLFFLPSPLLSASSYSSIHLSVLISFPSISICHPYSTLLLLPSPRHSHPEQSCSFSFLFYPSPAQSYPSSPL